MCNGRHDANVQVNAHSNDVGKYIWNVSSPYIPEQADSWGWPDVEIEEVRLDRDTSYERYTAGLAKAIEPATVPFTSTQRMPTVGASRRASDSGVSRRPVPNGSISPGDRPFACTVR